MTAKIWCNTSRTTNYGCKRIPRHMHLSMDLPYTSRHVRSRSEPHPLLRQRLPSSKTLGLLTKPHLPSRSPSLSLRKPRSPTCIYIITNNRYEDKTSGIAPFAPPYAGFHLSDQRSTLVSIRGRLWNVPRFDVRGLRGTGAKKTHRFLQEEQISFGHLSSYFKKKTLLSCRKSRAQITEIVSRVSACLRPDDRHCLPWSFVNE